MGTVLITGASGFIGRELVRTLPGKGYIVRAMARHLVKVFSSTSNTSWYVTEDLADQKDFSMLDGVNAVIHLAGRAHILKETAADPLAEFRRANVHATRNLARAAADCGVRRFVFISSIGVNGNVTHDQAFTEKTPAAPHNFYAMSKWEAEQELMEISQKTGIEVVVLRPPLVYGPGVRANFLSLLRWVERGAPLPMGAIQNQRSLIYVGNLVDAIARCLDHPAASGRTYLVSDGEDISTPELIRRLATAMERRSYLLSVPMPLLKLAGKVAGKAADIERLVESLVVDSSRIRLEIGWVPPCSMAEGLQATANWYRHQRGIA